METFVQTKVRPEHNMSKTAAVPQKQTVDQHPHSKEGVEMEEVKKKIAAKPNREAGVLPAIITTLLLIPLLLVVSVGLFICWRRNSMYYMTITPWLVYNRGLHGSITSDPTQSQPVKSWPKEWPDLSAGRTDKLTQIELNQTQNVIDQIRPIPNRRWTQSSSTNTLTCHLVLPPCAHFPLTCSICLQKNTFTSILLASLLLIFSAAMVTKTMTSAADNAQFHVRFDLSHFWTGSNTDQRPDKVRRRPDLAGLDWAEFGPDWNQTWVGS